jgi:hypothetical protein
MKPVFMPIKGARSTRLFASCSMDLITDLPPIDDCDSILVMVDRGNTKGAILILTAKTLTKEGAGLVLRKLSWLSHMPAELEISEDQLGPSSAPSSRHTGSA